MNTPPPPPGFEFLPSPQNSASAPPPPPDGFEMVPHTAIDPRTNQPVGVPEFRPPGVSGYDPQTGEVSAPRTMVDTISDRAGAFSTGGLQGVPIIGPYLDRASSAAAAAMAMPFSDKTFGQLYDQGNQYSEDVRRDNPKTALAGNVTGAVAGTVPAVIAAPEAFGAGQGPLYLRSLYSALTGAAIGGADAGVRNGLQAVPEGAAWGGSLGALFPGLGQLIGKGVGTVAQRFAGPAVSAAERMFGRAASSDAALNMAPRLKALGDSAMPMDLGPNLQRQAGALAATPGEGQAIVRDAIAARDAGANARINQGVNRTIGRAPDLAAIQAQNKANMDALGPEYTKAFQNARAINAEPIANNLESQVVNLRGDAQKAARAVRRMLNVNGTDVLDPHPGTLFQTRQAIDGMLATETNPKAIAVLTETRKAIDNQLALSVPGIKKLDARFAELARQNEALTRGQQALDSGRTAPRPGELANDMQQGAIPQGDMPGPSAVSLRLRQGARAEIDRVVGTNANDRVALQRLVKGEGDWNRERLATLFGQEKADRIIGILDRERTFADTSNVVTRNSETAARAAAMQDIAPQKSGPGIVRSALNLRFGDTAADAIDRVIGGAKSASQRGTNTELARLLTSNDPAMMSRKIHLIQAAQRRGDISAQRARELIQGVSVSISQQRQQQALPTR